VAQVSVFKGLLREPLDEQVVLYRWRFDGGEENA